MKTLLLLAAALFATPAMADGRIACEGTLEHGSAGEYIASKNKPTCWFGELTEEAVLAVCQTGDYCKASGASKGCAKDPDLRRCRELIKLDSVSTRR